MSHTIKRTPYWGESGNKANTLYINVFLHTDRYKESKDVAEEKRQIELELQAARKKLAEEMEQHRQCRREFAEAHQKYMRKY